MALTNDITYAMRNQTFVLTGRLTNYTREQARTEIQRRGGKVEGKVQRYTDVLICGDKPGTVKTNAAAAHRVTMRDEQWLMAAFLRNTPGFVPRQRTSTQLAPDRERTESPSAFVNQRPNSTARDYILDRARERAIAANPVSYAEVERATLRRLGIPGYNEPESTPEPEVKASVKIEKKSRSIKV
jgi:hypothetical protein